MSYLHVDAINQQFPAELLPPPQLLILTKFAEKLSFGRFSKKIGRDTLMKITHIADPKTLRRHLLDLHKKGILLCPQLTAKMRDGDEPRLFTLRYPEPFDVAVINERRNKYYGGQTFSPKFSGGDEEDSVKVGEQLESVCSTEIRAESKGDLSVSKGNLTVQTDKIPSCTVKIPPYNNTTNKDNNNDVVVVGAEEEKFLDAAVKAAGGSRWSYNGLVSNAREATIALQAVRHFQDVIVPSGLGIKSSIGFLRDFVAKVIAAGGLEAFLGGIRRPKVESESEKVIQALAAVLGKYLARPEFALLSKEEKTGFARTAQSRFFHRDGNEYLQVCLDDFLYDTKGHNFASAAELLKALDDYTEKFLSKRQLHA